MTVGRTPYPAVSSYCCVFVVVVTHVSTVNWDLHHGSASRVTMHTIIHWDDNQHGAEKVVVKRWASTNVEPTQTSTIPASVWDALRTIEWSQAIVDHLKDQASRHSFVPAHAVSNGQVSDHDTGIPDHKLNDLVLPTTEALRSHWIFDVKFNAHGQVSKYKARWVCDGSTQPGTRSEFYCSTPSSAARHAFFGLAAQRGYPLRKLDVRSAFLYAPLKPEERVLVKSPPGVVFPGGDKHGRAY